MSYSNKICIVCGKEFTPSNGRQKCCCKECSKVNRKQQTAKSDALYYQIHKDKYAEYHQTYYQANKDKIAEYNAKYRQINKSKIAERVAEYHQSPQGRAHLLLNSYRRRDREHNRGACTLTTEWIVENIFNGGTTNKCHYCGKELPYTELGCDRKDSSLSHTPENCVPCCFECNNKKRATPYVEYVAKLARDRARI